MNYEATENVSAALTTPTPATTPTLNPTPAAPAPSISTIASCHVGGAQHLTVDRTQERQARIRCYPRNHADNGVASVNKKLIGKCAELDAVQKLTGNIRNMHYSMTMPWSDTGMRLVPTAKYFKYHQQMTAIQTEWEHLVTTFLDAYDWEISRHKQSWVTCLSDDYPTVSALTNKFAFRLSYIPLPDAGDFRIDIGNEAMEQVRSHYEDLLLAATHQRHERCMATHPQGA